MVLRPSEVKCRPSLTAMASRVYLRSIPTATHKEMPCRPLPR
jgi:hypothetical protein